MARRSSVVVSSVALFLLVPSAALACGGLIGPRGSVNLVRTTTLAAYHRGVEHYVTSFTFTGEGGGKFGSIVPLPGVPTKVERGGDWTLQRLVREVRPPVLEYSPVASDARGPSARAEVLLEAKIDALDITILKGGGVEVGRWATENGFELSADAPEVLDFYARRSPIFMAARFDQARAEARGQLAGDGTPIHLTIPTQRPWVPLRILGLGKDAREQVGADIFLLTERAPSILPAPDGFGSASVPELPGMQLSRSEPARRALLRDLASDKGMRWLPTRSMWLTYLKLDTPAGRLTHDLAIDPSGGGQPSWVSAGLPEPIHGRVAAISRPVVQQVVGPVLDAAERTAGGGPDRSGAMATAGLLAGLAGGLLTGRLARRRRLAE